MDNIRSPSGNPVKQEHLTQEWVESHKSLALDEATVGADCGLASRLYLLCQSTLRQFYLAGRHTLSREERACLREELGKFYLWGEAFAEGQLDKALEYSEDVQREVLDSLGSVGTTLVNTCSPPTPTADPILPDKTRQELSYLVEQAKCIAKSKAPGAGEYDGDESSENDTDEEDFVKSIHDGFLLRDLTKHNRWLGELSPILEQNLSRVRLHERKAMYPPIVPFAVSRPALTYVGLVRDKFKSAGQKLVERLGEANWQRHIKIREQLDPALPQSEHPATSALKDLVAHSVFRPYSAFHDSGIGTSLPAVTAYAPSHTSFRSSASEGVRGAIRVPPTPAEVGTWQPFQCFVCKMTLSTIRNRVDWKLHIFADLKPYICTFSDCPEELAQFSSRAEWAEHEFSQHRVTKSWKCPKCSEVSISESAWENHIQAQHKIHRSQAALQLTKRWALQTQETDWIANEECPLCCTNLNVSRRNFVKHVGAHMEEIALIALPRNVDEDEDQASHNSEGDEDAADWSPDMSRPLPKSVHDAWNNLDVYTRTNSATTPHSNTQAQYNSKDLSHTDLQMPGNQVSPGLELRQQSQKTSQQQLLMAHAAQVRATQQQRQQQAQFPVNSTTKMTMSEHYQGLYKVQAAMADNDSGNQAEHTQEWKDAEANESSGDNRNIVAPGKRDSQRSKEQSEYPEGKWTEITRDLVSEEAIKERGYEFETTRENFYVMKYLRYEDVQDLVDLTEDIKHDRKRRIGAIEKSKHAPSGYSGNVDGKYMDLGSPGHVHPDKESSTESQVYNLSRYRAYPLGQRMDAKEIRTSSLPPASYVESLPGGQVSSVNQPARSPRSMDYSNGQDEPPNMYHQSPSHRQDMICGCQICLATEPKISESPVKEFASPLDDPYFRSPLQSESIRERNPLRSNEAGGALLPENADWETVNQDDIGPSDSASRPQTPSTAHKGSQSIQIDCEEIERDQRYSEESWETEGYYHVRPSDSASRPNDPYRATFPPISPHEKSYRVENDSDGGLETHHGPFRSGIRRPDTESHIAQTGTEQDPGVEPSRALLYCVAGNCRYRTDRKIDLRRHYKVKHRHNERTLSLCAKRKGQ